MNEDEASVRTLKPEDNTAMAVIIRSTLKEFGLDKPGTVYYDKTTDALFQLFQTPGSVYFVLEQDSTIVGGGGIFPSPGLPEDTCELVKMYLVKDVRGKGYGQLLIQKSLDWAEAAGYRQVYLETMPELKKALSVYEKFGFEYINAPMGNTGHFGCDLWMLKKF
jgi:putative acetyltransferase